MSLVSELVNFASIGAKIFVGRVFTKEESQQVVLKALSELPGVPAKVGQFLGMKFSADPVVTAVMNLDEVKSIVQERNPKLFFELDEITPALKAASIGQVHQGRLKDGRTVAIKVQYPGVAASLGEQIKIVMGTSALSPVRNFEFDAKSTKEFLTIKLTEECDYLREVRFQKRMMDLMMNQQKLIVPKPYEDLSSPEILVQQWVDSESFSVVQKQQTYKQCCQLGEVLTDFVFTSLFEFGLIHTDLNPANYGAKLTDQGWSLVIYDFGSNLEVSLQIRQNLVQWIHATKNQNSEEVFSMLCALGFDAQKLSHLKDKVLPLSQMLLEPLLEPNLWSARSWNLGARLDQLLGGEKWWFRTAGAPWFLYLMRTIHGWAHALSELDVSVSVSRIYEGILLRSPILSKSEPIAFTASQVVDQRVFLSKHLRILITDHGEDVVDLTMPARSVEDLEELLPESVHQRCLRDGIDLKALRDQLLLEELPPQEVFSAKDGDRSYRVWLE